MGSLSATCSLWAEAWTATPAIFGGADTRYGGSGGGLGSAVDPSRPSGRRVRAPIPGSLTTAPDPTDLGPAPRYSVLAAVKEEEEEEAGMGGGAGSGAQTAPTAPRTPCIPPLEAGRAPPASQGSSKTTCLQEISPK